LRGIDDEVIQEKYINKRTRRLEVEENKAVQPCYFDRSVEIYSQ
jgi:hypothetical protein